MLTRALQYDHNKALVDEFEKSWKEADQRSVERLHRPRMDGDNRLPGPDSLLESIASGIKEEEPRRHLAVDTTSADEWLRSSQLSTSGPLQYSSSPAHGLGLEPGTPGIPLLLAQARTASMDPSEMSTMYDYDNTLMALTDFTGALPDGNSLMPTNDMHLLQMNGSIDPAMYHQAPPGPSPGFVMVQHGMFADAYTGQYANGQADATSYGHAPGYG